MNRFKVEQISHYDELPPDEMRSLFAVEAAGMFREAVSWIVASGDKRANVAARAATIGVLFGYYTREQAAEMGDCSVAMISKLKDKLCEELGLVKRYNEPMRRKKE